MSALHTELHRIAKLTDTQLRDPSSVTEAFDRQARWAELRAEPSLPTLDRVLADTPVKSWTKTIDSHALAVARQSVIQSARSHSFDTAVDATVRAHADEYLSVLAPSVQQFADTMIEATQFMTTTDASASVLNSEGEHLHRYQRGLAIVGSYASLCATVVRGLKSTAKGGLSVFGELAVVDPGTIPAEVRDRDHLTHRTLNPEAEKRHINAARDALRSPRTSITDLIGEVARGHDHFTLAIPSSRAQIDDTLAAWDRANLVYWSTDQ